jgi:hypothetical protein
LYRNLPPNVGIYTKERHSGNLRLRAVTLTLPLNARPERSIIMRDTGDKKSETSSSEGRSLDMSKTMNKYQDKQKERIINDHIPLNTLSEIIQSFKDFERDNKIIEDLNKALRKIKEHKKILSTTDTNQDPKDKEQISATTLNAFDKVSRFRDSRYAEHTHLGYAAVPNKRLLKVVEKFERCFPSPEQFAELSNQYDSSSISQADAMTGTRDKTEFMQEYLNLKSHLISLKNENPVLFDNLEKIWKKMEYSKDAENSPTLVDNKRKLSNASDNDNDNDNDTKKKYKEKEIIALKEVIQEPKELEQKQRDWSELESTNEKVINKVQNFIDEVDGFINNFNDMEEHQHDYISIGKKVRRIVDQLKIKDTFVENKDKYGISYFEHHKSIMDIAMKHVNYRNNISKYIDDISIDIQYYNSCVDKYETHDIQEKEREYLETAKENARKFGEAFNTQKNLFRQYIGKADGIQRDIYRNNVLKANELQLLEGHQNLP